MYKNIGRYYMVDQERVDDSDVMALEADQIIYEVVRVINNQILFRQDHMERLRRSLELVGASSQIVPAIEDSLDLLLAGHKDYNKNIKIDVYEGHYRCYFVESSYPKEALYDTGIETTLYKHSRSNPEVKALNMDYKARIEAIKGHQFFEVLLENEDGYVLEGSKSNLLFVKDHTLISAPLSDILNGVTFRNVIGMAEGLGIPVVYRRVHRDELIDMDACFITGTSIGVLPIKHIDAMEYDIKEASIMALMKGYQESTIKPSKA